MPEYICKEAHLGRYSGQRRSYAPGGDPVTLKASEVVGKEHLWAKVAGSDDPKKPKKNPSKPKHSTIERATAAPGEKR